MPRKSLGDQPLTAAERMKRMRERQAERAALAAEAVAFVLALRPDATVPPRKLVALQRKLEELR
jgi:hypothetical protein